MEIWTEDVRYVDKNSCRECEQMKIIIEVENEVISGGLEEAKKLSKKDKQGLKLHLESLIDLM